MDNDIDNNKIRFFPALNANGADSFTFTAADGAGATIGATLFNITINATNDALVIATNAGMSTTEDMTTLLTNAMLNITDVDNTAAQVACEQRGKGLDQFERD